MKKLFIYYSYSGNGDVIAKYLEEKGYDIRKVTPKKELPKNFFLSMMVGGFKASISKKDVLMDFDSNVSGYDKIVIGSPIWNDRLSSPINTVINALEINDNYSFILYSGSGKGAHAIKKIEKLYNINSVILKTPKTYKEELDKLSEF